MAQLGTNPAALNVAATVLSGVGSLYGGFAQKGTADDEASQLLRRARARRAEAQRVASEERRQGRLRRSRAIALAAASGGGVDDPTVQSVLADIDADANYRALMAMYEGSEEAIGLTQAARKRRKEGTAAALAGGLGAARNVLSGVTTLKSRYGGSSSSRSRVSYNKPGRFGLSTITVRR